MKSIIVKGIIAINMLIIGVTSLGSHIVKGEEVASKVVEIEDTYCDVNIAQINGISIVPTGDSVIYSNMALQFACNNSVDKSFFSFVQKEQPEITDRDYYIDYNVKPVFRISTDNGNNFSEWKEISGNIFVLNPENYNNGLYIVQLGKMEKIGLNDIAQELVEHKYAKKYTVSENNSAEEKDNADNVRTVTNDKSTIKAVKAAKKIVDLEPEYLVVSKKFKILLDTVVPDAKLVTDYKFDSWKHENIKCSLEFNDVGSRMATIKVFADEKEILNKVYSDNETYSGGTEEFVLSEESIGEGTKLIIEATDRAGNVNRIEKKYFIDKTAPDIDIEGVENDEIYNGKVCARIIGDDKYEDYVLVAYTVKRIMDGNETIIEEATKTLTECKNSVMIDTSENGYYVLECHANDLAGNGSKVMRKSFKIDTEKPVVSFAGVENNAVVGNDVDLAIAVADNFPDELQVEMSGYVENANGTDKLHLAEYKIEGQNSTNTYYFTEDGDYTVEVSVVDEAGNEESNEISFSVDKTAPQISVSKGIDFGEYLVTNSPPTIGFKIQEKNFETSAIVCELRKKSDKDTMELYSTPDWVMNGEKSEFSVTVSEEGEYVLNVSVADAAGNVASKSVNFTLDMTSPTIDYLDEINQKYVKSFKFPGNFDDYIDDETEVSYETYLNSMNFDKDEVINEDGKYILKVQAVDGAGNEAEKTVEFIVDNTVPKVVVEGMDKDGNVNKDEPIVLSLYDEGDYFASVKVGDEEFVTDEKQERVEVNIPDYGNYEISIKAVDKAENILEEKINAKCANATFVEKGTASVKTLKQVEKKGTNKGVRVFLIILSVFVIAGGIVVVYFYIVKQRLPQNKCINKNTMSCIE